MFVVKDLKAKDSP